MTLPLWTINYLLLPLLLQFHHGWATEELHRERLNELLESGKSGFVKFYMPWCGHCKRMQPDWDLLAEHYLAIEEGSSSVFIADVNCMVEESLCSDYHTGGTYPTILVFPQKGSGSPPELYQGGRSFEDLRKFVDQQLVVPCNINQTEETCNGKSRKYIAKWKVKDKNAQNKELERLRSMAVGDDSMTYNLSKWIRDRIRILEQLLAIPREREL